MINREIITQRLIEIDENLKILDRLRTLSLDEFKSNPEKYKLAERCLQICIECVIDIGDYIIAGKNYPMPQNTAETITTLGDMHVIPREFALKIVGMANFRNILIHAYLKIDREIVYKNLQNIPDFRAFQKYILEFLKREGL